MFWNETANEVGVIRDRIAAHVNGIAVGSYDVEKMGRLLGNLDSAMMLARECSWFLERYDLYERPPVDPEKAA